MRLRFLTNALVALLSLSSACFGLVQDTDKSADASKQTVNEESLERVSFDTKYLAADALEGRGVQTKGLAVAADYVREEFKKIGLKGGAEDGSFYQYFDVSIREKSTTEGKLKMVIGGEETDMTLAKDFQPLQVGGPGARKADIVFVGYGIKAPDYEYDDYAGVDVDGKIVMMIRREPQQKDADSVFNGTQNTPHSFVATKIRVAKEAGARGVLFVNDGATDEYMMQPGEFGPAGRDRLPMVQISRELGNKLIAASPVEAGDKKLSSLDEIEKYIDAELKPCSSSLKECSTFMLSLIHI